MFTGIIEDVGIIDAIQQTGEAIVMTITSKKIVSDVQLGDSIAVNGVCLTVTSFTDTQFTVDLMPETVRATSLRLLSKGSRVNLERAMVANGRFGGHIVSGHVDGIGTIRKKERKDNAVYYTIEVSSSLRRYMIHKGSVAVDGTSLTIFDVSDKTFTISIIPHTMEETIIGLKKAGDIVNIECDLIGKYIEQFVQQGKPVNEGGLTKAFLTEHGYN
ncbi:riboflavin synthase [Halalkalibacterium halodurans]|uniref:riboflavin synthase n=1 Tax=Halalkalibacterium halodurans TaxID=86665 RepID=UPI002AA9EDD1|nr:riboflavin synthase [Halalkalibacterium halodurans]MDY7222128.1 riboflavin synthase [Halalkalibacterium halodurans]MDY7241349.1 riboflavin synthase [Halalkalibacterium halodurans]MED4081871.1 riboflavin synthase [Halalkalibacterium halodurans]MED4086392.1 riboflavin synthase [Halalkalibacterium halodurans]MED4105072.1 riboflavin synthase [Halalkalibacterium halodurans]